MTTSRLSFGTKGGVTVTVISVLAGGKILAKETGTFGWVAAGESDAKLAFAVRMNELRKVDTLISIKLTVSPEAVPVGSPLVSPINENVVGFTVVGISTGAVGVSVTPEVVATGYA